MTTKKKIEILQILQAISWGLVLGSVINLVWAGLCWLAKKHILLAALPVLLVVGWWHRRDLRERYNRGRHNVGPTTNTSFTIEGEKA